MKTILPSTRRQRAGFTLVELLVVIAIIAILAAMLLPVISRVQTNALKGKAKVEESGIVTAIQAYDSAYGRFPTTQTPATGDFTYGGSVLGSSDNSEVIAILMNITNTTVTSVNQNAKKNPQQTVFLNAHMSGDTSSPGVGTDLIYRDPWGNPYVISMDLNYDGVCEDAFYGSPLVSANTSLTVQADGNYAFRGTVMVWSAGPDKTIAPGISANSGANKDNIVSWQQ